MKNQTTRSNTRFCKTCRLHGNHDTEYCPNATCEKCGKRGHLAVICRTKKCSKCEKFGHSTEECHTKYCRNCQKFGHNEESCFALHPCDKCKKFGHSSMNCRIFCGHCGIYGHVSSDHFTSSNSQESTSTPSSATVSPSILSRKRSFEETSAAKKEEIEERMSNLSDSMSSLTIGEESSGEDIIASFVYEKRVTSWADEMDEEDKRVAQEKIKVKIVEREREHRPTKSSEEIKKNISSLINQEASRKASISPSDQFKSDVSESVKDTLRFLAENPTNLLRDNRKMSILVIMAQLMDKY